MSNKIDTRVKNWLADNGIMTLLFTGLTVILGIAISEIQALFGWVNLAVALILVCLLYWSTIWIFGKPLAKILLELKEELIQQRAPTNFSWLLDTEQLASYERTVKAKEIWLITSDLLDDSSDGPFHIVVRENLKRKIKHVYFFPDTPENRARATIIHKSQQQSALLKFVYLPNNFFLLVPKLDVVIYNPQGESGMIRAGFMGIPVPAEGNHYHAAVSIDLIDKLVGTVSESYTRQASN
jgi:hypothetical protein